MANKKDTIAYKVKEAVDNFMKNFPNADREIIDCVMMEGFYLGMRHAIELVNK